MNVSPINIILVLAFCLLSVQYASAYDSCCSYPCQNRGICTSLGANKESYTCDCSNTGYYGKNCESGYISTKISRSFQQLLQHILTTYGVLRDIVNSVKWIRNIFLRLFILSRISDVTYPALYRAMGAYPTYNGYINDSMYVRTLPPVPLTCPTPLGVKGKKEYPSIDQIIEKVLKREKFVPDPSRTNLNLPFYNQHFTHQLFHVNREKRRPFQNEDHAIGCSHVYGLDLDRENELRSHVDGKMKVHIVNGEIFPPLLNHTTVNSIIGAENVAEEYRFVYGNNRFTLLPMFLVWGSIWIREHNRVCDLLKSAHPTWDDERLFQTARLIIIGETISVTLKDYVFYLSTLKVKLDFSPDLLFNQVSYENQIHVEFDILYQMHTLVPNDITLNKKKYSIDELVFNPEPIVKAGIGNVIQELNTQFSGKGYQGKNFGKATLFVTKTVMEDCRRLRLQSFNNYRRHFMLEPYKTFEELTGEKVVAAELEKLYGDIEAVEFYPGLYCENRIYKSHIFGELLMRMIGSYAFKGITSNPIASPGWWKSSTFGGDKFFNLVKETTMQELICRNVKGECPEFTFSVPEDVVYRPDDDIDATDKDSSKILIDVERRNDKAWKRPKTEL